MTKFAEAASGQRCSLAIKPIALYDDMPFMMIVWMFQNYVGIVMNSSIIFTPALQVLKLESENIILIMNFHDTRIRCTHKPRNRSIFQLQI